VWFGVGRFKSTGVNAALLAAAIAPGESGGGLEAASDRGRDECASIERLRMVNAHCPCASPMRIAHAHRS
jgi:hypothetical protein